MFKDFLSCVKEGGAWNFIFLAENLSFNLLEDFCFVLWVTLGLALVIFLLTRDLGLRVARVFLDLNRVLDVGALNGL